jgi:hypothetical protein
VLSDSGYPTGDGRCGAYGAGWKGRIASGIIGDLPTENRWTIDITRDHLRRIVLEGVNDDLFGVKLAMEEFGVAELSYIKIHAAIIIRQEISWTRGVTLREWVPIVSECHENEHIHGLRDFDDLIQALETVCPIVDGRHAIRSDQLKPNATCGYCIHIVKGPNANNINTGCFNTG